MALQHGSVRGFAREPKLASFLHDMRRVVHARQETRNGGSRAVSSDFVKLSTRWLRHPRVSV
jgi:hypothetical protein